MPYGLRKEGDKTCVYNTRTGATVAGGCHDSRVKALKHQRAMMLNVPDAMSAAVAPIAPPRAFFERPEAAMPQPLTYYEDGAVDGHLALWQTCHSGFQGGAFDQCVMAPRTATGYQMFHLGQLQTAEGEMISVGKLTYDTSHAPLTSDLQAASTHYDHTGSVGAFVRASDGRHGIWLSGVIRSDLAPEGLRDLRANPPSGDWRSLNGHLELVAALAVPVPGFPIPRSQLALAASGDVQSLILPAPTEEDLMETESHSREYLRQRGLVASSLVAAPLTSERRNNLPRSSFAIPEDRAYPIHDRAHARNALARSSGKPEEARVRRAVCRRYPDMCRD